MWKGFGEVLRGVKDRGLQNGVILGDCVKVMKSLPSESVDLVLTDPPYLVDYTPSDGRPYANDDNSEWLAPAFREAYRLLKPNRFAVSFYGWPRVELFMDAWKAAGFVPVGHLVFVKDYPSNRKKVNYFHEQAYLLAKGHPEPNYVLNDVMEWGEPSGNRRHPTEKPLSVMLPLVGCYSKLDEVVLDPFAGSGTSLVAAKRMGRRYLGIELVREYALAAARRLDHSYRAEEVWR